MSVTWDKSTSELNIGELLGELSGRVVTLFLSNGTRVSGRLPNDVEYASNFTRLVVLQQVDHKFYSAAFDRSRVIGVMGEDRPNS